MDTVIVLRSACDSEIGRLFIRKIYIIRGVRQGCPVSPLLFALAMEPLATAIRSDKRIQGFQTQGIESKLAIYADDLVVFLESPLESIRHLHDLFIRFGIISGYKVNDNKSIITSFDVKKDQIFLFGNAIIDIPASILNKIHIMFNNFIWRSRRSRIKLSITERKFGKGVAILYCITVDGMFRMEEDAGGRLKFKNGIKFS